MNTMDDLRSTLAAHAEITDDGVAGRAATVAARGRTVRRNRRVALAGGVAAAVVAGGVGVPALLGGSPGQPEPAGSVVGVEVPETIVANGWTYEYSHQVTAGSGNATIELTASDTPRLFSWATEGENQYVTVQSSFDGDSFASSLPDFTDFSLVHPGSADTFKIQADSALGVAIYELSDDAPDGRTDNGVVDPQGPGAREVLGYTVGPIVEYDGHTWELAEVKQGLTRRGAPLVQALDADQRTLLGFVGGTAGEHKILKLAAGQPLGGSETRAGEDGGFGLSGYPAAGAVQANLTTDSTGGVEAAILVYRLVS